MWRQKPQDHMAKKMLSGGKIRRSRFVLSDCSIASCTFSSQQTDCQLFLHKNFEGGKFKRHFHAITPIPHSKSRRGLVRFQMSHLWLALESTSKVLNLTCNRTSALPNKGSPCRSSSLTLIIVRCLQRIETIDHSVIDCRKSHTSAEHYVVLVIYS